MQCNPFEVAVAADEAWPIPAGAGAGVARVLETALQRAGIDADATLGGHLWLADGWQAEIMVNGERKAAEAAFALGHHLLGRLAEFAAHQLGGELSKPALSGFEDLATSSPLALLAYLSGLATSGAERMPAWRRAFELDPSLVATRAGLARELLAAGNIESAAALLGGWALHDGFLAAELGIGLWAAGETAVSFELLQAAVKANPENGLAMAALAALMVRRQGAGEQEAHEAWDEALLLATQATQLASDDFRCWAALADVHRAGGDFSQAGFFYGFALKLDPDAVTVLKDASACWLQAKEPRQALPLIKRAIAADPKDAENLGNLAFAHLLLGDRPQALQAARRAAELGPQDERLRILHGDLALQAGEREEALEAWARAVELEPGIMINPEGGNLGLEVE